VQEREKARVRARASRVRKQDSKRYTKTDT